MVFELPKLCPHIFELPKACPHHIFQLQTCCNDIIIATYKFTVCFRKLLVWYFKQIDLGHHCLLNLRCTHINGAFIFKCESGDDCIYINLPTINMVVFPTLVWKTSSWESHEVNGVLEQTPLLTMTPSHWLWQSPMPHPPPLVMCWLECQSLKLWRAIPFLLH